MLTFYQRSEDGFTLIELLVAVFILAVAALSLMMLFPLGLKQVTEAGRRSTMSHLGHEKIDELKAKGYDHADLTAGTHPTLATDYLQTDPDFTDYSLKWTVTEDSPVTNVKTVALEVGFLLYDTNGNLINSSDQQFQLKEVFVTYIAK